LFIFGVGTLGKAVVKEAQRKEFLVFDSIAGTTRRDITNDCNQNDVELVSFYNDTSIASHLFDSTHVLITIPPQEEPHPALLEYKGWLGLVSTTGVYGNHDGAWVTEDAAPTTLNEWASTVFRCAGLYGNTRSALDTVRRMGHDGTREATSPTSRIHERDAARAMLACMARGGTGVYNLADDEPASRKCVFAHAARLLEEQGIVVPISTNTAAASTSKRARRRGRDKKRVSNARMRRELLADLLYPTYKEGLQAVLQENLDEWKKNIANS